MIMRVFQVTTHPGKEAEFSTFFHKTAIPLMKSTKGIVSVSFGAARSESPTKFCIVMIWDSLASLKAFVGEDYGNAHTLPEEAALIQDRMINHYDLVDA